MAEFHYKAKNEIELLSTLKKFFMTGEKGSCLFISFKNTSYFIQFAISAYTKERITFEFGLPETRLSKKNFLVSVNNFSALGIQKIIENNDETSMRFLRVIFDEMISSASDKAILVVRLFMNTFHLNDNRMKIKVVGDFYGSRISSSIDESYERLKNIKKIGIIGKLLYKLQKNITKE
jgi:hypothetical protein